MLILAKHFINLNIASIQAGHRIGYIQDIIIKPSGLSVYAFLVKSNASNEPLYLHTEDVLEMRKQGIVIDHNEQLMPSEDLIRLQEVLKLEFNVIGKNVTTESGSAIGTVVDYTIDTKTWEVSQIKTQPKMVKMFSKSDKLIGRSQILSVTDRTIIVQDASIKKRSHISIDANRRLALSKLRPEASTSKIN